MENNHNLECELIMNKIFNIFLKKKHLSKLKFIGFLITSKKKLKKSLTNANGCGILLFVAEGSR
jgi:hypothetical protein